MCEGPSLQAEIIGSLTAGQRVSCGRLKASVARGPPAGPSGRAHSGSLKPVKELVREVPGDTGTRRHGDTRDMTRSTLDIACGTDLNGTVRDWAWPRAKYGNVSYLEADGYPKFQLLKVEEMEGPQTMLVSLQDENGAPHSGQPVVLSWPSLLQPSQDLTVPSGGIEVLLYLAGRGSADRERVYGFRPGRWQLYQ